MKEIKHCLVLVVMFFSFMNIAHAGLEITEIMYDPPQEQNENYSEWIEIYNPSGEIDLKNLLVCNNQVSSGYISHVDNSLNKENNLMLGAGKFAIITDGGSGTDVYDNFSISDDVMALHVNASSMCGGLSNTEETITLSGLSSGLITLHYPDSEKANGDGNSLQLISGKLKPATPTPGIIYSSSDSLFYNSSDNNTDNVEEENTDTISSSTPTNELKVYKISTKIIAPKIVTAGVPFEIDHNTTGINKEKIILGKFIWNFGDGRQKQLSVSDAFSYVYDYPGEYVITLSYSDSSFEIKPDATDRLTVKVISSGIIISSVGTYTDPFVELENKSNYEMAISGWILKGSLNIFVIPEGTVILPNKKLKLSPKITGFNFNDLSSISIIDISGQVFATYPNYIKSITKYSSNNISKGDNTNFGIVKSKNIENKNTDTTGDIGNTENVINLNDLGASAASASDSEGTGNINTGFNNKTLIYLGLIGIIIIGALSIILLRPKSEIPDYIDKEITAENMKIIE